MHVSWSKKVMNFLFGKKFPIFDSKGEISHKRLQVLQAWKVRYRQDETKNWRHHSGRRFKK